MTEYLIEKTVSYVVEVDGKLLMIENVPARVNVDTGEQFFAPQTVDRIQQTLLNRPAPVRILETPVYEFAA